MKGLKLEICEVERAVIDCLLVISTGVAAAKPKRRADRMKPLVNIVYPAVVNSVEALKVSVGRLTVRTIRKNPGGVLVYLAPTYTPF